MTDIIRNTITLREMLPEGSCVAVALSGGADSVCLLCALHELAPSLSITLRAIHINHGIRGETALRDENFCRELCSGLGVELDVIRLDIPAIAAQRGIGLEQCGRECRYEQFAALSRRCGCIIATAHTLSDSAETVLFNLARGSGLAGVCGIPPVRILPGTDSVRVVRPLIDITRRQVEEYCASRGLSFVTDETNSDTAYRRNLIRHEVIPGLMKVNPSLHSAIGRFTGIVREDSDYLDSLAVDAEADACTDGGWNAKKLAALPEPVLRRVIILISRRAGITPEHAQVMLCREYILAGSGGVMLGSGVRFVVNGGIARTDDGRSAEAAEQWEVPLTLPETLLPDGRKLFFKQISLSDPSFTQNSQKTLFKNTIGCGIIKGNIFIRNRREGDRFAPAGRGVTKKLKKLLCDENIPTVQRDRLAIISGPQGILWVEGFGSAQSAVPAEGDVFALLPVFQE